MSFDIKAGLAKLATFNKANAAAVVAFVGANILIPVFHIDLGPEWQVIGATVLYAGVHWVATYWVANKPVPAVVAAKVQTNG